MAAVVLSEVPCDTCIGDKPTPAKFHCNTCGDALCATCKIRHLKSKGSRHHSIVPYEEKLDPKLIVGLLCHTHLQNASEYWCETCSAQICLSCITKEHQGHTICNMTTRLSEQRDAMVKELKVLRDSTVPEWEDALIKTQEIIPEYTDEVDKIDEELVARAKDMHTLVDTILFQRRQSLQQITAAHKEKLQDQEKYLSDRLQQMKDAVQRYEEQLIHAEPDVFLQFEPESIKEEEKPPLPVPTGASLPVFSKGNDDTKPLEDFFGQISESYIELQKKAAALPIYPSASAENTKLFQHFATPDTMSTSKSLMLTPSLVSRPTFGFGFSNVADNDSDLTLIRTGGHTLQLMDREGSVKAKIDIMCSCNSIALTPNGDIIMSCKNCIKLLVVSRDGEIRKLFDTECVPSGVCCLQNGDYIVTFKYDNTVAKYSSTGNIKQKFNSIVFKEPSAVAASKVNQDIYIVNLNKNLTIVGSDGRLHQVYSGQGWGKFTPSDVCADLNGHILITDKNINRIHILDWDCRFIQYIPTTKCPCFINVTKEGYLFVDTSDGPYEVYKYLE